MKTNVAGAADCLGHHSSETTVFMIRKAVRGAGGSRSVMCRVVELSFIAVRVILLRRAQKEIGMWQAGVEHYTGTVSTIRERKSCQAYRALET